ncbi:hypothetical protein, partial [Enterobacter hormaechei]|uniref:hypothetical protein n=1 Tax=Enterobacter hormaechei TaxID=158836 RepID=UPI00195461E4
ECSTRPQIIGVLNKAEESENPKYKGLDGVARDKLVGALLDLAGRCAEYTDRRNASSNVSATEKPKLRDAVANLRRLLSVTWA